MNATPAPATPAQPVQELAQGGPLYELPYDYKASERTFTVSIAGPERHDAEKPKPHAYLVSAHTTSAAWAKALAWFMTEHDTPDAYVVADASFEGKPDPRTIRTDLRPEFERQAALDDLADQAAEIVTAYETATYGMAVDGDVHPDRQAEYDKARSNAQLTAWPLVQQMAEHDGR